MWKHICRSAMLAVSLAILAAAVSAGGDDAKSQEGFVSLFNGNDLTGWKTHPADKAQWEVKDGAIVGSGPAGHLFSERGDYANFIFRIEAKINRSEEHTSELQSRGHLVC